METANWYADAFAEPSVGGLIAATLSSLDIAGPLEHAFESYLGRRHRKNAFRPPPLFDAAVALGLAEAYRASGDEESTRRLITRAVELYLGVEPLLALEAPGPLPVFRWQNHLGLPAPDDADGTDGDQGAG